MTDVIQRNDNGDNDRSEPSREQLSEIAQHLDSMALEEDEAGPVLDLIGSVANLDPTGFTSLTVAKTQFARHVAGGSFSRPPRTLRRLPATSIR